MWFEKTDDLYLGEKILLIYMIVMTVSIGIIFTGGILTVIIVKDLPTLLLTLLGVSVGLFVTFVPPNMIHTLVYYEPKPVPDGSHEDILAEEHEDD